MLFSPAFYSTIVGLSIQTFKLFAMQQEMQISLRPSAKRLDWIDWMKTLAMYLIVWGHFFSPGHIYAYVFSVPVFFVISGFLDKRDEDFSVFFKKLFFNLFVPMMLMAFINFVRNQILKSQAEDLTTELMWAAGFFKSALFGSQGALVNCWFIYTLILMRMIHRFTPVRKVCYVALFCVSLVAAYWYKDSGRPPLLSVLVTPNAAVNVVVAYPFFIFGVWLQSFRASLDGLRNSYVLWGIVAAAVVTVWLCARFNGYVWVYGCDYGNNPFLYLLGGVAGTALLYGVSRLIAVCPEWVRVISRGTILILGFHAWFIHYLNTGSWLDFFSAALILVGFVPVILLAERYCPIIMGKYRVKRGK